MNWNRYNILKLKKVSGIYIFKNKINNKVYIGQTVDFYMRYCTHIYRKEKTIFSKSLHKNFNNFQFGILEVVKKTTELNKREEYWIEFYKSYKRENGYNQGKYCHAFKRKKFKKLHCERISKSLKGIKRSPESYRKGLQTKLKLKSMVAPKKINQIDVITLRIIRTYDSIKEAADATNTPRRSISYSIENFESRKFKNNIFPKAGDYYWSLKTNCNE